MKKALILTFIITLSFFSFLQAQEKNDSINLNNTALVIIDIQNFYFPGGQLPLDKPEIAAENAKKLLQAFRERGKTVIHVKHNAKSGSDIYKLLTPIEGEKIIKKNKANAFVGTDLLEYLKQNNIKNLVLCGMQTHMCLEATTRAASDYGFNCTVVEDACTTRDLKYGDHIIKAQDVHYSTLATLKGTYANILTTNEFLHLIQSKQ